MKLFANVLILLVMLIMTSATAIVNSNNENGATFTAKAEYNMTLNDNTKVVMSPDHKLCSPCVLEHEIGDKQCAWAPSLNKKAVIECKLPCWEVNKWCKKECYQTSNNAWCDL